MGIKRTLHPHIVIKARAGTGKTTTLIQALRGIKGMDPCLLPSGNSGKPVRITPSDQQLKIWEAVEKSKEARSITFVAFNRSIAAELKRRVPEGVYAKTMHGLGFGQIHKTWNLLPNDDAVCGFKVMNMIEEVTKKKLKDLRKDSPEFVSATNRLVSLCKMNLTGSFDEDGNYTVAESELFKLASHYDVDMNGSSARVFATVPKVMELCYDPDHCGYIDYDDMVWLPVVHKLNVWRNDLLLVDEAQDLNPCQQELACMAGSRIILCGDDHQAIYGWAGADTEGLDRMIDRFSNTKRGCKVLKLTETRRCGKAIVKEANAIVSDFTAHESNSEGKITKLVMDDNSKKCYRKHVKEGDMIICRVNAPLVSECFKFIKDKKKANIQGRDIGAGLVSLVKKMNANDVEELLLKLEDWHDREVKKEQALKFPNENRIIMLGDKYQCLRHFCEDQSTVGEVIESIEEIFTDRSDTRGVLLSSGHKAKGLEAERVFFLEPEGATCPHPMAKSGWQMKQELNLRYVITTRAINELFHVS